MPYDETLAAKIRQRLAGRKNLSEKKMFGGVGFLLDGNICCGAWNEFLILRLGEDAAKQCSARSTPGRSILLGDRCVAG